MLICFQTPSPISFFDPQGRDGARGSTGLPGADGRPVSCSFKVCFNHMFLLLMNLQFRELSEKFKWQTLVVARALASFQTFNFL